MTSTGHSKLEGLLEEAPFVQALARALAGPDAEDVAQGAWLRVMEGDAVAVRDPRRWLACVLRGVAHNLRRSHSRLKAREQAIARCDLAPSPAQLLERQELRRELLDAVEALPEPQRHVVLLRHFENLPPRRIAAHLGLPLTTVTSRLRTALATMRQRLDARHGDRAAWLVPLLSSPVRPTLPGLTVLAMAIQTKILIGVAVLVLATIALFSIGDPSPTPQATPGGHRAPLPSTMLDLADRRSNAEGPVRSAAAVGTPEARSATGTLIVKATYADDGQPVVDLVVLARRPRAEARFGSRRARTDAGGIARVEALEPGSIHVTNARNPEASVRAEVVEGKEVEVQIVLATGVTITGIVVDRLGAPVPGAEVCLAGAGALEDAEPATASGPDGRFELRGCPLMSFVGARAVGHRSSEMQFVTMAEGSTRDLRLVLPAPGGAVAGTVTDPTGAPVPDAVVAVGERQWSRLDTTPDGALRAIVRTDAEGRFRAVGLPVGQHAVRVRAVRWAPWTGACHVDAGVERPFDVTLGAAMSCVGVVVDSEGAPVAQAAVEVGDWNDLEHYRTTSADDGSFRLDGLPPGALEMIARHRVSGTGKSDVFGVPGETVRCELRVEAGLVIRGRVRTESDEPIAGAMVDATTRATPVDEAWGRWATSGADGHFAIPNCPASGQPTVTVTASGFEPVVLEQVDPRRGDVEIRMTRAPEPDAYLVGTVVAADGTAVPQALLTARERRGGSAGNVAADQRGRFSVGPIRSGTWSLHVRVPDQPTIWTRWYEVGARATADLGEIQLPVAGTILVRLHGADDLNPSVSASDVTLANWTGFTGTGKERHSGPLVPGPHYVALMGDGVAARLIPVDVRAGERRELDVDVQSGRRQSFEIVAPSLLTERHIRVLRNGESVTGSSVVGRRPGQLDREYRCDLAPGDYTITVHGDGMSGDRRFTVGEGNNEVVRVILR
jgi:RNA polymerase sigma-70 factor (ECF subfamily)